MMQLRFRCIAAFCVSIAALTGCAQYEWKTEYAQYQAAEQEARQGGRHMFVFYKYWLDSDSNRMLSNEVLSDPEVTGLFQNTINLLVEKDFGPQYAEYMNRYNVTTPPAAVIVRPDGSYRVRQGFVPKEEFIRWAREAMSSPATAPARTAPK